MKLGREVIEIIREALLSIDKFEKPTLLKGNDAVYTLLLRLLMITPGTFQSHPNLGVGIATRWRYMDQEDIPNLKTEIEDQIAKYLPKFQYVDVDLEPNENSMELDVKINIDNTLYTFKTDSQNNTVNLTEL